VRDDAEFIVFLGTWCSDSKKEVPRFLKVVDRCGVPAERVKLYGLDRSKKSPDGLAETYGITKVPTFIVLKHGREVGRITELPQTTLEADLLTILASAREK
jgi:thiol-disulfide isomerase/thioredoxin